MEAVAPAHGAWSFQFGKNLMKYEGDFIISELDGKKAKLKHGTGIMRWPDGREYQGQFRFDKMHGEGSMSWPTGAKYVGQYHNNRKEGIGKLTLADGSRYEGNFYEGKLHNEVLYIKPDGNAFHMEFNMDKPVSQESIPSFDGWTLSPGYEVFVKSKEPTDLEDEDQCSEATCCICLGELRDRDTCCQTACKHVFHKDCLDAWVRQNNRCPLCVQKIPLQQVYSL